MPSGNKIHLMYPNYPCYSVKYRLNSLIWIYVMSSQIDFAAYICSRKQTSAYHGLHGRPICGLTLIWRIYLKNKKFNL